MKFFRMRFPTFTTVSSVQSRTLFLFLLLSAAIVLALSSVIERPHAVAGDAHGAAETTDDHADEETSAGDDHAAETDTTDDSHAAEGATTAAEGATTEESHASEGAHGTAESHAVGGSPSSESHTAEEAHPTEDQHADAAGVTEGTDDAHVTEAAHPTEDSHAAEAAHATEDLHPTEAGHATAESHATADAHESTSTDDHSTGETGAAGATSDDGHGDETAAGEEHAAPSLFGVDLDPLNLSAPRFIVILIAATILVTLAALVIANPGMLAVVVVLSLVGVAASVREAAQAGEELGLFVRLPLLAAVLYAGAGALALLQLARARTQPEEEYGGHAAHGVAAGEAG
jgi:hypothetical protein